MTGLVTVEVAKRHLEMSCFNCLAQVAKKISENKIKGLGAIASDLASKIYGLVTSTCVLAEFPELSEAWNIYDFSFFK